MAKHLIKRNDLMGVSFNFIFLSLLGNYYNIKNLLNEESVLLFTQIKRWKMKQNLNTCIYIICIHAYIYIIVYVVGTFDL